MSVIQGSVQYADAVSLEELKRSGELKELSLGFSMVPDSGENPFNYMFKNGAYLYAKLSHGIELPVEHMANLEMAFTEHKAIVSVDDKVFYEKFGICYKRDSFELHFGKSIKYVECQMNKTQKLRFALAGTLSERIQDEEFIIDLLEVGHFKVGENEYFLSDASSEELTKFDVPKRKEQLKWLKHTKELLDALNVQKDMDCTNITDEDSNKIRMLKMAVLDKTPVALNAPTNLLMRVAFSNLTLLVCVKPAEGETGKFMIYDFNHAPLFMTAKEDDGTMVPSSIYVILGRENFLECCNINYTDMLMQLKGIPFSDTYSSQLNMLLLELLLAFDDSDGERTDILETAIEMATWLKNEDTYAARTVLELNYYQSIKRSRELFPSERSSLLEIIEATPIQESAYVGAYLLLGEQDAARMHYERMDAEAQEVFRTYPIFRFWKESN